MNFKKLFGIAAIAVVLIISGCSERVPPVAPGGPNDAPFEYDGPQLGAILAVTDGVVATTGYEWIGNTFITDGRTGWGAARFTATPFTVRTYAGHWYNAVLVRDGRPVFGGYTLVGTRPQHAWMNENDGIFFAHIILVTDDNHPWIWQWGSNLDSLVTHDVEVLNWTRHERLGLVGTATCYSTLLAPLVRDGTTNRYTQTLRSPVGSLKLAAVNVDTGTGLDDSVTIRVNGVELTAFVDNFTHSRWPDVKRYFRYHVALGGTVTSLGTENRWTFGNTLRVTTPYVDPSAAVWLEADWTRGERWPMTFVGSGTWERTGIMTWVGPQTLQIVTQSGDRVFRTVRWNGEPLHHLTVITLDPNPPVQAFKFTPRHDRGVGQGADNLTVDIDIGR